MAYFFKTKFHAIMGFEYVLFGFMIILFIYFGMGPGSRLFKKKSHHYIVPPTHEKDPDWYPIENPDYMKFIYFVPNEYNVTSQDVENVSFQEVGVEDIKVESLDKWFKVEVRQSSFNEYHSAIMIYNDINGGDVYGFCKNKDDSSRDYIVKQDKESEYLLGVFRTNENFAIYIPSMDKHPKGNISISSVVEMDFIEEIGKLPI